jgi:hypothetical protein
MEIPACCPRCDEPFCWELDLTVDRELAWAAPNSPAFTFLCTSCQGPVRITFAWSLERGSAPRHLRLVGEPGQQPEIPCILLVDHCPHGCGTRLGLRLEPGDPWALGRVWPDESQILGGYRCPSCDGEGRLRIQPVIEAPAGDLGPGGG